MPAPAKTTYTIANSRNPRAIQWARLRPFEGERKVMVLEAVERLSDEALNAFLKLLEEPPPSTTLILLAENPAELKKTLLSRCFQISLRAIKTKGQDKAGEEDNRKLSALLSRYSYELVDESLSGSGVSKAQAKRDVVEQYLGIAQAFLRDVLIYLNAGEDGLDRLYFKDKQDRIREKAGHESTGSLVRKLDRLEKIRRRLDRYANPKLSLRDVSETVGETISGGVRG